MKFLILNYLIIKQTVKDLFSKKQNNNNNNSNYLIKNKHY